MWIGIQITATMTAVARGSMAFHQGADQEPQLQPQAPAVSWQGSLLGWPLAQASEQ